MNFLFVVLLSATIHQVVSVMPKRPKELRCPTGFDLFHRTPTERNNHTSGYCLKIVRHNETYDHDLALTLCANEKAVLTTVENYNEWRHFTDIINGENAKRKDPKSTLFLTVDGVFNPYCKDYSNVNEPFKINDAKCQMNTSLFLIQDVNTDPTFIFTKLEHTHRHLPYFRLGTQNYDEKGAVIRDKRFISECLSLIADPREMNLFNNACRPEPRFNYIGALCGTRATEIW